MRRRASESFLLNVSLVVLISSLPALAQEPSRPLRESELLAKGLALPDFDSRQGKGVGVSANRRQLAADLQRRLGRGSGVSFNPQTGGVHHLFHTGGFLSQPQGGEARSASIGTFLQTLRCSGFRPRKLRRLLQQRRTEIAIRG